MRRKTKARLKPLLASIVAVGQTVSIVSPAQKHVARRYLRLTGGNRSGLTLYHTPESLS